MFHCENLSFLNLINIQVLLLSQVLVLNRCHLILQFVLAVFDYYLVVQEGFYELLVDVEVGEKETSGDKRTYDGRNDRQCDIQLDPSVNRVAGALVRQVQIQTEA